MKNVHQHQPKIHFSAFVLVSIFFCFQTVLSTTIFGASENPQKEYFRMVVLGDPHLPGNRPEAKKAVINEINSWKDVDFVAVVGDLTQTTGTANEYAYAKKILAGVKAPLLLVNGNHDYVFSDSEYVNNGVFKITTSEERNQKLDRFMKTFDMQELSYSKNIGRYHLIFLSLDSLDGKTYARLSEERLKWLEWELFHNKDKKTLIFTHAPLWTPQFTCTNPKLAHFITQPQDRLLKLVQDNPQIVLWVSGHVHLGALNSNSVGPVNKLGQTTVINNCDLDGRSILSGSDMNIESHSTIWTTSLYLFPNKIQVKVFDHTQQKWLDELSREFPLN